MSKYFDETIEMFDKVEQKLDLILELIDAQKREDWEQVEAISAKFKTIGPAADSQ